MDKFVLYLIGSFFVIRGIDYITGNHLKLGGKFEEVIKTMGAFLGIIIASTLGAAISFAILVALGMFSKEDEKVFF